MEFLIIAAIAAVVGTTKLILDSASNSPDDQQQSLPFPTAQVRGPGLAQLKRKGMLNPHELSLYCEYLEGQLERLGNPTPPSPVFRVPSPETQAVQGVPQVPHQVIPTNSPPVPQGVPQDIPQQFPSSSPSEQWDPTDEILELLATNPNATKSSIAFTVFGLTREDKSGSPNSRWMQAMAQIDHCQGLLESAKMQATRQQLHELIGGLN